MGETAGAGNREVCTFWGCPGLAWESCSQKKLTDTQDVQAVPGLTVPKPRHRLARAQSASAQPPLGSPGRQEGNGDMEPRPAPVPSPDPTCHEHAGSSFSPESLASLQPSVVTPERAAAIFHLSTPALPPSGPWSPTASSCHQPAAATMQTVAPPSLTWSPSCQSLPLPCSWLCPDEC